MALAPGLIGIVSSTMGRYREFDMTLSTVIVPPLSSKTWELGLDLSFNYNKLCRKLLKNEKMQWLWILGDDHVFKPNILIKLLARGVDIVAPLCLKRSYPFVPVIYTAKNGLFQEVPGGYLDGKNGVIEVGAMGNAGMLIRRNVIEKMGSDWHRIGWHDPERGGSDLYFCKRAREEGFKIHVDLDNTIGHIAHMAIWPVKETDDKYSYSVREPLDLPK